MQQKDGTGQISSKSASRIEKLKNKIPIQYFKNAFSEGKTHNFPDQLRGGGDNR